MSETIPAAERPHLDRERHRLLRQLVAALDRPMTVLAFVWLVLLIVDFTRGLTGWLASLNNLIWGLFVAHFLVEFLVAPEKVRYLRKNWLTAIALLLPALRVIRVFRVFRLLRAARAVHGTGLIRLVASLNRGMRAVRKTLHRRGFGYVVLLTALVTFGGAAGMYSFEKPSALREEGYGQVADAGGGLGSYGEAVWWTAMTMTTMGADYFPKTPEGRLLGWLLAVYAFAVFGYITATLASYFIGRDREAAQDDGAAQLRAEIAALRTQLAELTEKLQGGRGKAV